MLRLIAFSIVLSLCLPSLLVSFFQLVGGGSAQNDLYYSSYFQCSGPDVSDGHSAELTTATAGILYSDSAAESSWQDGLGCEQMNCIEVTVDAPVGDLLRPDVRECRLVRDGQLADDLLAGESSQRLDVPTSM